MIFPVVLEQPGAEELKPNGVYGGRQTYPIATELGELENGRAVRSNTYDDPQQLSNNNGGITTPTYDTVASAKKEMLNVSGPRVLNPVYGPTGTPTTPISPNIPLQATPVLNPIYSETQVSQLNPIYAAIGTTPLQPAPAPPRYANTHNSPAEANAPDSFKRVNSESGPTQLPMYEELHTVKPKGQGGVDTHNSHAEANAPDSFKRVNSESGPTQLPMYEELHTVKPKGQGGMEDSMTKNESYGLLMNNSH